MTNTEAKDVLQEQIDRYGQEYDEEGIEALEIAIKALEQTSYKSDARRWKRRYLDLKQRIFKMEEQQPCEDVLDKIKAEIIEKFDNCSICEWFENYDYDENDISEYMSVGHILDIIDIIDKYRK